MIRAWPASIPVADRTPENRVTGWYYHSSTRDTHNIHLLDDNQWPVCTEIDIATAAVETGKDAKNGPIFGSMGDMQGGDYVKASFSPDDVSLAKDVGPKEYIVIWGTESLQWQIHRPHQGFPLSAFASAELEIIPPAKEEGK